MTSFTRLLAAVVSMLVLQGVFPACTHAQQVTTTADDDANSRVETDRRRVRYLFLESIYGK